MTPERLNEWVESTLRRFNGMDWGVICDEDKETNLVSAKRGGMVMGQYPYNDAKDLVFWPRRLWPEHCRRRDGSRAVPERD